MDYCNIEGIEQPIIWYSMPEYIPSRYMYQFTILDPHHLFTNSRTKCCSCGIPERGLQKEAWVRAAKGGKAGLNIALVEDLVDRQSDAIAHATFSQKVEENIKENGSYNEVNFCRLLREWYSADDDPGISGTYRCELRLNLRKWLLSHVQFNQFPPSCSHIRVIPLVMFEGLMTSIEQTIQLYAMLRRDLTTFKL